MLKKTIAIAAALMACLVMQAETVAPNIKSRTSFAIIIDARSYAALTDKVKAYRDAVEADGLATWIVAEDFRNPEQVKEHILKLRSSKAMPLEGVVFIGDIPVPMIRDGQYLTSAFKMAQSYKWTASSIPSDRFYDDFDLKFEFLKQDEENPSYFYYSIGCDSAPYVCSDIYSARVRAVGKGAYTRIGRFLDKAVASHAERKVLDRMFVFCGHGYNSDAFDAWSGEQVAMREQLPSLFAPGARIQFSRHDALYPLKNYLLEQLVNEETDLVVGHHHGAKDKQYLNGLRIPTTTAQTVESLKRYFRSKAAGKENSGETIAAIMKEYGVDSSWIDISDSTRIADEKDDYALDLHMKEIYEARPNSRLVILDACFNGSFHLDDCVADAYIFSEGKTICVQGNSVNSLQDRLPDRYLGVLALGANAGQWARINQTVLETHLIGDPTFRFSPKGEDISAMMRCGTPRQWKKALENKNTPSETRAVALRMLRDARVPEIREILKDAFYNSPDCIVRNEALALMQDFPGRDLEDMVLAGLDDSYELLRRRCANLIGCIGSERCPERIAEALLCNKFSKRVQYQLAASLEFMDPDAMAQAVRKTFADHAPQLPDTGYGEDYMMWKIDLNRNRVRKDYDEEVLNRSAKPKVRLNAIRYFRNYHVHYMIPELIALASDSSEDEAMRLQAIETLGWFRFSARTGEIIAFCDRIISSDAAETIRKEARKTRIRLTEY